MGKIYLFSYYSVEGSQLSIALCHDFIDPFFAEVKLSTFVLVDKCPKKAAFLPTIFPMFIIPWVWF